MRKNAVSFLEKDARYAEKCGNTLIPSAECAEKCGDSPVPAMNYAQKCGKNCFFVKTGGSVIGQKSSNCAEECGKKGVLPGKDVPRRVGILRTMRKSAVKTEFYRVRTF